MVLTTTQAEFKRKAFFRDLTNLFRTILILLYGMQAVKLYTSLLQLSHVVIL